MNEPSSDDLALQRRLAAAGSRDERRRIFADHMTNCPEALAREARDAVAWFMDSAAKMRTARITDLSPDTQAALASHYCYCHRLLEGAGRPSDAMRDLAPSDALLLQGLVLHHVGLAMTHVALIKQPGYVAAIAKSVGAQFDTAMLRDVGSKPDLALRIFTLAFEREAAEFPEFLRKAAPRLLAPFRALHAAAAGDGPVSPPA